jgi:hypothetical protein
MYTTSGATFATDYIWEITPAEALTGMTIVGTECTITWAYPYNGPANIKVKGTNQCGEGDYSAEVNVQIENVFGIDELADALGLAIYPNPNNGSFTLEMATTRVDKVNLRIVNATGYLVYEKQDLRVNGNFSTNIDISPEAEGIYLMIIESDLGVYTSRILIQK